MRNEHAPRRLLFRLFELAIRPYLEDLIDVTDQALSS